MALSKDEREQFLAQPHIAALSVDGGTGRGPLTVPMWYQYTPGGEPWVLTATGSRKAGLIEAAGCFTLMVERVEPSLRYVAVEGAVSRVERGTDAHHIELAHRYLPPARAEKYLEFALSELGEQLVIHLRPRHWVSAELGAI
ncbi:pyridoxamine 5'-phosphate oxidase family protein [Mycobacterium sp. M1]|uniref:Pyridoxamine 5'-phosphate oxidase family protein n=1 Tax=Mycolicibacter acidiphilus TaxID=2835306 RepID=A0ABS5RDI5_9MYCO|nr:pyridoxamine 5'-phosphate oxidase family protein [Mycolicibacter acidiphilus]MBS9532346.1 pyridoxamine 5'-phosphate oxidase family protein [Mycolicibacter acidiphilus]